MGLWILFRLNDTFMLIVCFLQAPLWTRAGAVHTFHVTHSTLRGHDGTPAAHDRFEGDALA